jgi:hypothetical protein
MRRILLGLAVTLGLAVFAPETKAQTGFSPGFSDPFFLYYGFYLPRQQYLASQPSTANQINDIATARQNYALADRAGLYDPNANNPFAIDPTDPLNPYRRKGAERLPRLPGHFAQPRNQTQANPAVNSGYFNRTSHYYPGVRSGSFANKNIGHTRGRVSGPGMGGMGMPGIPGR